MFLKNIFEIVWSIPAVLIAITIHEYSHGLAAYYLGDPTAKIAGRLTLNPVAHLDPVGTLMLILFRMGWAKPVPVNYGYFKNPKKGMMIVSIAGPLSNIIISFLFSLVFKLNIFLLDHLLPGYLSALSDLFFSVLRGWFIFIQSGIFINLALAFFNLIPIPPLDGHHILLGFLPIRWAYQYTKITNTYGMLILLLLIWTGFIGKAIFPIVNYLYRVFI